jgi:hypothetical protein
MSHGSVVCIYNTFQRNLHKAVCQASLELSIPCSTVHDVSQRRLKLQTYRLQLVNKITHTEQDLRKHFVLEVFSHTEKDTNYLNRIYSSDEATFSMYGIVNRHKVTYVWGSKNNPHEITGDEHDSSKVNT